MIINKETSMKHWLLPTFGAFVLWGFWSFIPKITTRYISPRSAILFEVMGGVLVATMVLFTLKFKPDIHLKGVLLAMTTGGLGFLGALCYLYAVSKGPVSLIAILTALSPVITVTLSVIFLNETISLKQGFGIVLGLAAMILICT
ncbi:MAG: DMT family transporter [Syntrophorhabdus sp.]|nr:DMT family transporter [Syntrophorhabdus sp.]HNQ45525.1 DMT family transporter [Syntrophorhabdus sp.]HOH26765.1 DMT family transporter [Syntrophorhabdus sp.]HPW36568.1 DMT family transporter [Syntrophorhabdus sp.]HQI95122.1 DMT family transporter [Syntrophorhabdus sp.]